MPAVTEWPEDVDHDETGDDVIDVVSDDEAVSDLPDEMTEEPIDTGNEQATPEEEVDPIQSEDDGAGDASQQDDPTSENPVLEDESFSELPEEESEAPIDVETEGDMPADEVGSDLPEDDGMGDDQQADPASDEVVPEDESFSELPEETTEEPIDGGNEQDTPAEEVDAGLPEEEGVGDASPQDNPSFYITDFRYVDHWKNCNERLRLNKNGDDLLRPGDLFGSEIARLNSLDVVATEIRGGLTISYLEGGGRIESGKHDGVNRGVFYYNEQGEFVGGSSTLIGVFSPRAATELIEWNGAEPEVIDQEAVSHEELDEQDSLVGVPQEDTPAPNVTEESEQPAEEVATTDDEVEVPRVDNEMDADSLDPQAIDLVFSLMSELEASIP